MMRKFNTICSCSDVAINKIDYWTLIVSQFVHPIKQNAFKQLSTLY